MTLCRSTGQPYNQLAILASSKGDHLTTIFYYCRSIAVKFPFPAASTNLQKALSKALERYGLHGSPSGHLGSTPNQLALGAKMAAR